MSMVSTGAPRASPGFSTDERSGDSPTQSGRTCMSLQTSRWGTAIRISSLIPTAARHSLAASRSTTSGSMRVPEGNADGEALDARSPDRPATICASLFGGRSLEQRLEATRWRPSGFDYMRLVLALGVICWHSTLTSYGGAEHNLIADVVLFPLAIFILPMFFSLSGFLVAGSLERSKTFLTFLGLRVFRIMPALAVEVLLSALILGPLLTTLSLGAYVRDSEFHAYFLNIVGDIHYLLPGVFTSNPF